MGQRTLRGGAHWMIVVSVTVPALVGAPARAERPAVPAVELSDCAQQIGVFPIDASAANPLLPEGFEAVAFQDSGPNGATPTPPLPASSATVQMTATTCTAAGRRVSLAQVWLYVKPPAEMRAAGVDSYLVVPWGAASDERIARQLDRLGLPFGTGTVANDLGSAALPLRTGEVMTAARGTALVLSTRIMAAAKETRPERLRLFGIRKQRVTGVADFVEAPHTHLMGGVARLTLAGGTAPFPLPDGPGVALHVDRGYALAFERVE